MDNYIDWTGKNPAANQSTTSSQVQPGHNSSTYSQWQTPSTATPSSQTPYNPDGHNLNANEVRSQAVSPASYPQQSYAMPYVAGTQMSPSISPPISNTPQYTYPQMVSQGRSSSEEAHSTTGANAQGRHIQSSATNTQQLPQQSYQSQAQMPGYTNPYTYANNSIYGNIYAPAQQGTQNYAPQYNGHTAANAGAHGTYGGYQSSMPTAQMSRTMSPQLQYNYSQNGNHGQYMAQNTMSQYQRPEDALKRMNGNGQSWSPYQYNALPPQTNNMQHAGYPHNNSMYAHQWQQQQQQQQPTLGQTVYFPMDNKPAQAVAKPSAKPSSPPRPKVRISQAVQLNY